MNKYGNQITVTSIKVRTALSSVLEAEIDALEAYYHHFFLREEPGGIRAFIN